jgi:hypothetical protein
MYLRWPITEPVTVAGSSADEEFVFWMRTFDPSKGIPPQLCCDAILQLEVRSRISELLDCLAKRVLRRELFPHVEFPYPEIGEQVVDAEGRIRENWGLPLSNHAAELSGLLQASGKAIAGANERIR